MKVIVTLFFMLVSMLINAQIVNIPDANFKNYLLGHPNINTNSDTEIQTSEAENYTGLINVSNQGISDLTGIEAFVNITSLYCHNNNLSNLDLSANIALVYLYCYNNILTTLDVSNSTPLIEVQCYNNRFTDLDFSNNPNLFALISNDNLLQNLNLKNGNNVVLTTMNATNNPNLSCIEVDNVTDAIAATGNYTNWQIDATSNYSEDCANYVGIDDFEWYLIKIFPNPTTEFLNIKVNHKATYFLIDILGNQIRKGSLDNEFNRLNITNLSKGIYTVVIEINHKKITQKIVKY